MPSSLIIISEFPGTRRQADGHAARMKWWHLVLLMWTITGLAVCSETSPDYVGHAHPHDPSHLSEPWDGSPAERVPDDGERNNTDFHYHLTTDYSEIDSGVPSLLHVTVISMAAFPARGEDELPPAAPAPEPEMPPLIGFRLA